MSGFTIIEVLVSTGLCTLLMAALYSAMNVYYTTAVESYDEIERVQVARSILRQMARDIQSCTFVEKTISDSDETGDTSTTGETGTDTEPADADSKMESYTDGLFGTDRDLVLYVSRPDRNLNYVSSAELTSGSDRSGDGMIIRYFLAERGAGGLSGALADEAFAGLQTSDTVAGLAVMQGDLIGLSTLISQGNVLEQQAASDMMSAEVAGIRFTYFDGVEEMEEWDSTQQNAMPQAVIIELTLRSLLPKSETRDRSQVPNLMPESVHRLVVPIPVAKPYIEGAF
ncbi:MAG: hypothetical protein R3C49_23135 [Planctomycetaceae bacterium]